MKSRRTFLQLLAAAATSMFLPKAKAEPVSIVNGKLVGGPANYTYSCVWIECDWPMKLPKWTQDSSGCHATAYY